MAPVPEILRDTHLSADARVVALEVHLRGEGRHEISHDEWSILLNQAGAHRVRKALKRAELVGWIERHSGGGGHSDTYERRVPESATLKNTPANSATLSDGKGGEIPQPNGDRVGNSATLSAERGETTEGGEGREVGREVGGSAPAREGLSEKALQAIEQHAEKLEGCRDSLKDYLDARVDSPTKQFGYVQTVAGWLEGTRPKVWRKPNGRPVDEEVRTALLAAALNDLLATDEEQMARPVGDTSNLETKVGVIIAKEEDPYDRDDKGGSGTPGRETRSGLASGVG